MTYIGQVQAFSYESKSIPGLVYRVNLHQDGDEIQAWCSCRGFSTHQHCWHVDDALT